MKWFKHLAGSLNNSLIFEAIERFGGDGYLVFFGILEMMADEIDIKNPDVYDVSLKKVCKNLQLSRQKTARILRFFDEKAKINSEKNVGFFATVNGDRLVIKCKRFKELADTYTERMLRENFEQTSNECSNKLRPKEVEEEIEYKRYMQMFELFWSSYPKRNGKKLGKKQCHEWWKKNVKADDVAGEIVRACGEYAKSDQAKKDSGAFVRDPIRFLRADYWRDWVVDDVPQKPVKDHYEIWEDAPISR